MIKKRLIFAGTPDFSVPVLQALIEHQYQIVGVYTQPDRRAGRGRTLTASPVKQLALEYDLKVFQPEDFKSTEAVNTLSELKADLMVVVAYGLLLPQVVLDAPRLGCINIHASLLPRWRGAAPIQRAILAGDKVSGITLMQMDKGLDTGDILYQTHFDLNENTTGGELHDTLSQQGASALIAFLPDFFEQKVQPVKQNNSNACYAKKLTKAEALLDWSLDAKTLHRQICAFNPYPVSHTLLRGKKLRIWQSSYDLNSIQAPIGTVLSCSEEGIRVATGQGTLIIQSLQLAGKKRISSADFIHAREITNEVLS